MRATDTMTMRPGLVPGPYPEKKDRKTGLIDRYFNALQGRLARSSVIRKPDFERVVADINSHEKRLQGLNNAELQGEVILTRRKLKIKGLCTGCCINAFALIRELSNRTLRLRHYDTQLMAGWVMLQGQAAEVETGEGKTLAATLAAATVALAGIPVHVITVNEYLVMRDADAIKPLYEALGLTVGYVTEEMTQARRRAGYACDITYCTNKQVAFDYLRDRLFLGNDWSQLRLHLETAYTDDNRLNKLLLRGLCFAIVDEADSVLIDEARTPLILTREADSTIDQNVYHQAIESAQELETGVDYFLNPSGQRVQLSLSGQERLEKLKEHPESFWHNARQREDLIQKALHALHFLKKDRDYLVHEGNVLIIDANTGRTMPERSWEQGLHQLVEAKEGCPLTNIRDQLARITYQRFFRRYLRLGGMTGTAREVSSELWSVYGLLVRRIPLHRPSRRIELPSRVYPTMEDKWAAIIEIVKQHKQKNRPVLIGTGSVADSEKISLKLNEQGIPHQILNARQNKEEAEIIAIAGRKGQITVATNMAGRGTDIPLVDGVSELGGLHVISACRNEARRIDRQLYGRCARQGDPGSHQTILSLEDELVLKGCCRTLIRFLIRHTTKGSYLLSGLNLFLIWRAQKRIERQHWEARRALLAHDQQAGRMLSFSGNME